MKKKKTNSKHLTKVLFLIVIAGGQSAEEVAGDEGQASRLLESASSTSHPSAGMEAVSQQS